ncbi:hypothetical protein P3T25_005874 [Paraburkholderia sp. GAS32]
MHVGTVQRMSDFNPRYRVIIALQRFFHWLS